MEFKLNRDMEITKFYNKLQSLKFINTSITSKVFGYFLHTSHEFSVDIPYTVFGFVCFTDWYTNVGPGIMSIIDLA